MRGADPYQIHRVGHALEIVRNTKLNRVDRDVEQTALRPSAGGHELRKDRSDLLDEVIQTKSLCDNRRK